MATSTSTTSSVYINVIGDVINKVREEFMNSGVSVDDVVLNELQGLWESKMLSCGAITGPIERAPAPRPVPGPVTGGPTPVHDLNVPYEATEEYETPTADMLFPPTPLQTSTPFQTPTPFQTLTPFQTPMQTPLPGTADQSVYQLPTPNDYPSVNETSGVADVKPGRPSQYMQPPSPWLNPTRPLGVDVNVAWVEGRDESDRGPTQPPMQDFFMSSGKRKREDHPPQFNGSGYVPQEDGAGDSMPEGNQVGGLNKSSIFTANGGMLLSQSAKNSSRIPQLDGPITDAYEDLYPYQGVANEDYNAVNTPAPELQARTPAVEPQPENGDDDEPPLNENDDDDDFDEVDDQEEDPNMQHLVLAQFDKVTRTKSRWKCTLKDGIMHINNKDILFTKANGEFEF